MDTAAQFTPSTGTWASAGNATVQLSDCTGTDENGGPTYEVGPQVLRPEGSVVAFSGVATGVLAYTGLFNTNSTVWVTGDQLPTIGG